MGAVKNAMQRDGLDPTILDLDPEKSLECQRPSREQEKETEDVNSKPNENVPTKESIGDKSPSVWSSRVGYPSEWQALPDKTKVLPEFPALDEALYEMNSSMDSFGASGRKEVQPPLNKDPVYEKYYRMLKMVRLLYYVLFSLVLVKIANISRLYRDYQWARSRMQFKGMSWTLL